MRHNLKILQLILTSLIISLIYYSCGRPQLSQSDSNTVELNESSPAGIINGTKSSTKVNKKGEPDISEFTKNIVSIVAIFPNKPASLCTGTILKTKNYVYKILTAAHCFWPLVGENEKGEIVTTGMPPKGWTDNMTLIISYDENKFNQTRAHEIRCSNANCQMSVNSTGVLNTISSSPITSIDSKNLITIMDDPDDLGTQDSSGNIIKEEIIDLAVITFPPNVSPLGNYTEAQLAKQSDVDGWSITNKENKLYVAGFGRRTVDQSKTQQEANRMIGELYETTGFVSLYSKNKDKSRTKNKLKNNFEINIWTNNLLKELASLRKAKSEKKILWQEADLLLITGDKIKGKQSSTCHGDSGGPTFVKIGEDYKLIAVSDAVFSKPKNAASCDNILPFIQINLLNRQVQDWLTKLDLI